MRFLILHLSRALDREENVARLRATLPGSVEVVEAVDANDLSDEDIEAVRPPRKAFPPYPFPLRKAEIACFMSHRKMWRMIADSPSSAVIVEDDVVINPDVFGRALSLVGRHAGEEDVVRFPYKDREKPGLLRAEEDGARLFHPAVLGLGMQVEFVGRTAARRLLAATETFDRPVDTTLQLTWKTGVAPCCVLPSGVGEISRRIGGSTIGGRKTFASTLYREVARPAYRFALWTATRIRALLPSAFR